MSDDLNNPYSDYALACAKYGDCIFDEVQKGALRLEKEWENATRTWPRLIDKAAKKGFLGLGKGAGATWLNFVLFQPHQRWPAGLSPEHVKILRLTKAFENFHPSGRKDGSFPKEDPSDEETLEMMQKLALLVKKGILRSMWRSYESVSESSAAAIMPLCGAQFGEACSKEEAKGIFRGDLLRGWKMGSLDTGQGFSKVYPRFKDWLP